MVAEQDAVLDLLGASFREVEQTLGEPDDEGYGSQHGPHNYIQYSTQDVDLRFCSPQTLDEPRAVSIIVGSGGQLLNVKVGMSFEEIEAVLGSPDHGPEPGIDGSYYADYILDEVYISFSATCPHGPTEEAFIKLKALSE